MMFVFLLFISVRMGIGIKRKSINKEIIPNFSLIRIDNSVIIYIKLVKTQSVFSTLFPEKKIA